jgi:hypothetical protein
MFCVHLEGQTRMTPDHWFLLLTMLTLIALLIEDF